jgi:hypothetical protein
MPCFVHRLTLSRHATCVLAACAVSWGVCVAQPVATPATSASGPVADEPGRTIYQQRGADGRVTLTDRPAAGLATERRWRVDPAEDAASAAERREASRAQADAVTERIQRSIEQQQARSNELQIEQLRAQREADALAAERLRQKDREYESRPYVALPGRPWTRPPVAHPHPRPTLPGAPENSRPTRPPVPEVRALPRRAPSSSPDTGR